MVKRVLAVVVLSACGGPAAPPPVVVPPADHALHVTEVREGDGLRLRVDGTGVPTSALTLPAWFYFPVSGVLDVHVDLLMPHTPTRDLGVATGELALTCHDCTIGDPSRTPSGPGITSSRFTKIEAHARVAAGVATLVSWDAPSADIESRVTAHATLAMPPETSDASICIRFKPTAMTFARHTDIGEVLTATGIEIDEQNVLNFTLAGFLDELQIRGYGCDGHPQPPPAPVEEPAPPPREPVEATDENSTSVTVTRAAWEQALGDPAALVTGARFVTARKSGVSIGYKIYAIRPATMFEAVGLSNGDTVTVANGYPILGTDDELRALAERLKPAKYIALEIVRRGTPHIILISVE